MKKIGFIFLSAIMALSFSACAGNAGNAVPQTGSESTEPNQNTTQAVSDEAENSSDEESETQGNVLVAYFSATTTTAGVAQHIASCLGADLYEIEPETPYTDTDLNYNDSSSRTSIEMNDPDARPAISGSIDNMEQYDIIFIGYPIWWGDAPRIISTFLESYDFSGKTLIPFCTSASSGIETSEANLQPLAATANWLDGQRFASGTSRDDVAQWLDSLESD